MRPVALGDKNFVSSAEIQEKFWFLTNFYSKILVKRGRAGDNLIFYAKSDNLIFYAENVNQIVCPFQISIRGK